MTNSIAITATMEGLNMFFNLLLAKELFTDNRSSGIFVDVATSSSKDATLL